MIEFFLFRSGELLPVSRMKNSKTHLLFFFHDFHNGGENRFQDCAFRSSSFVQNQFHGLSLKTISRIKEILRNAQNTDTSLFQFFRNVISTDFMHFRKKLHLFHLPNEGFRHQGFILVNHRDRESLQTAGVSPEEKEKEGK